MSNTPYIQLTPRNPEVEPMQVGLTDWFFIAQVMTFVTEEGGTFKEFNRFSQGLEDADAKLTDAWHKLLNVFGDELMVVESFSSISIEVIWMQTYDLVSCFESGAHVFALKYSPWAENFASLLKLLQNCQGLTATLL
jgi:hypothetical protein